MSKKFLYSGTIWAKTDFRDPFRDTGKKSGPVPEIPGQLATMLLAPTHTRIILLAAILTLLHDNCDSHMRVT